MVTHLSLDDTQHTSVNAMNRSILEQEHQNNSCSNRMIRSPVKLDIAILQNSTPTQIGAAEIEQTISDVIEGKGPVSIDGGSISNASKRNKKQSLSSQLVLEQKETEVTTKTGLSSLDQERTSNNDSNITTINHSNIDSRTSSINHSPTIDRSNRNNLLKESNNSKKRSVSKTMNDVISKRSNVSKSQSTTPVSSLQSISQGVTTSPTMLMSSLANKQVLWTNTATLSSSNTTMATTAATSKDLRHGLEDVSWTTLSDNHDSSLIDYLGPNDESSQMDHSKLSELDLDDLLQPKPNRPFNASTPPPLSVAILPTAMESEIMTPVSIEKSTTSIKNSDDLYGNFLNLIPSISSQENQVTSSVLTPPDIQNSLTFQQQSLAPIDEHFSSTLQSKVRMTMNKDYVNNIDLFDPLDNNLTKSTK